MVSFCRKWGSVRFIEPWRTLAFRERGVLVDQIVHVIIDTIALVSKAGRAIKGLLVPITGLEYCIEHLRLSNRLSLSHVVNRIYNVVVY